MRRSWRWRPRRNQADKQAREKNSELLNLEREVSVLEQRKAAAALEEKTLLDKLWETYELSHEAARAQRVELESVPKAQRRVGELKKAISGLGNINLDAIEEFQRVNERYTYLTDQRDDVLKSKKELEGIIADITEEMKTIFARQFSVINEAFQQTFTELFGGGKATLELEEPEDILNCGIEIRVQPPGKALKVLSLLSGGEKAFVAIALYFAILRCGLPPSVSWTRSRRPGRRQRGALRPLHAPDGGQDPVHRHHPPPRHYGGGRRALRRHHAGAGREPDTDHQPERRGEGIAHQMTPDAADGNTQQGQAAPVPQGMSTGPASQ